MKLEAIAIRPFIGAQDFAQSRRFYADLGFQETVLAPNLSLFSTGKLGFYLQDAYNQDWLNNTMIFVEVADAGRFWNQLQALHLPSKYEGVRIVPVQTFEWGRECYVHDPSGMLWHFGEFAT